MTTDKALVFREIHDLDGLFSLLVESDQPVYVARDDIPGVLLRYQTYQELQEHLQDLEDLLAMWEAEAEYRAGESRPLAEILAELELEEATDVPG